MLRPFGRIIAGATRKRSKPKKNTRDNYHNPHNPRGGLPALRSAATAEGQPPPRPENRRGCNHGQPRRTQGRTSEDYSEECARGTQQRASNHAILGGYWRGFGRIWADFCGGWLGWSRQLSPFRQSFSGLSRLECNLDCRFTLRQITKRDPSYSSGPLFGVY